MRISSEKMFEVFKDKLIHYGVNDDTASKSAENLVENSLNGVYSHGVNRFPRVISYLKKGYIKPDNKPECIASFGALEKWDGNLGMGNTNAAICMDRAVTLAGQYGIGCVALRNTNHWMCGGAYGIQAAKAGCIGICWTNTQPNMPAWGAVDRRIGNNPLVFSIPYGNVYIMVDGAMAQFSYGAIELARIAGRQLPVAGGFDSNGQLTCDPAEIEKTWRVLPVGYWKGSGFSILMDMIAAALSEGNSTSDVGKLSSDEYALSQVFIAIDLKHSSQSSDDIIKRIIEDVKKSERADETAEVRYPSERAHAVYKENSDKGIPVDDKIWEQILNL